MVEDRRKRSKALLNHPSRTISGLHQPSSNNSPAASAHFFQPAPGSPRPDRLSRDRAFISRQLAERATIPRRADDLDERQEARVVRQTIREAEVVRLAP